MPGVTWNHELTDRQAVLQKFRENLTGMPIDNIKIFLDLVGFNELLLKLKSQESEADLELTEGQLEETAPPRLTTPQHALQLNSAFRFPIQDEHHGAR